MYFFKIDFNILHIGLPKGIFPMDLPVNFLTLLPPSIQTIGLLNFIF